MHLEYTLEGVISTGGGTTLNDGLVHAYKMDETSGNRVDAFGLANFSVVGGSYVTGKDGNAFDSQGTGYLYVSRTTIHPGTTFTYSGWFNRQGGDTTFAISTWNDTGGWHIHIGTGSITYGVLMNGSYVTCVDTLTVSGWNLITWWADSTNMGLRVNTRSAVTNTKSGTTVPNILCQVGANTYADEGYGYYVDLWADDLCVWNRVLTSDEITERAGKYHPFT